jgi:hypothetical protein
MVKSATMAIIRMWDAMLTQIAVMYLNTVSFKFLSRKSFVSALEVVQTSTP